MTSSTAPLIFELNARLFGKPFDEITSTDLSYFRRLGFTHIWLMGIWRISAGAVAVSKRFGADFLGSPYAIDQYEVNPALGTERSLSELRHRAAAEGLRLIVDFVPNHLAFDSVLVNEHPEFFIHFDPDARDERPEWYFNGVNGHSIAHGRDPYFPPWVDTAQLNYSVNELRQYMIDVLCRLAAIVDGVRCDMAMLLLREQIKQQWFPKLSWDWFNDRMPDEFWREAIAAARRVNPNFVFIAEAYWGKEPYLQELGFDFTYNKTLYDRLAGRGWDALVDYLELTSREFLFRSLHFIENHDEERAERVFGSEMHRQVAALITTLPGAPLIHQGQMEGKTEKLPVQVIRPRMNEPVDNSLLEFYSKLLRIAGDPIFRVGRFHPFDSGIRGLVAYLREHKNRVVLVAIDFREGRALEATRGLLSIPGSFFPGLAPSDYRIRDLWSGEFQRPARLEEARMLIDLDGTRNPGHSFHILEIVS
ncbi:MAG TPA: alpha-amylase family glycosyl hydrolase [Blastocatellia bacterium]|nr:alpha-amylase family glycosyl hydrolase [Blastocatellia bacterium]